jgi:chromosome segregation ATPase
MIDTNALIVIFVNMLIIVIGHFVTRIGISNMTEKAQAQAVQTVTANFGKALADAGDEREKRAKLEVRVDTLNTQLTEQTRRADTANERLASQSTQINKLTGEVTNLTTEIKQIRDRLVVVEGEKKALEGEKQKLENALNEKGEEYQKLMISIQEKIDKAVAEVRAELSQSYETRIKELETQIRSRDEEIAQLKALLKEREANETIHISVGTDLSDAAVGSEQSGTGGDTSPANPGGSGDGSSASGDSTSG